MPPRMFSTHLPVRRVNENTRAVEYVNIGVDAALPEVVSNMRALVGVARYGNDYVLPRRVDAVYSSSERIAGHGPYNDGTRELRIFLRRKTGCRTVEPIRHLVNGEHIVGSRMYMRGIRSLSEKTQLGRKAELFVVPTEIVYHYSFQPREVAVVLVEEAGDGRFVAREVVYHSLNGNVPLLEPLNRARGETPLTVKPKTDLPEYYPSDLRGA